MHPVRMDNGSFEIDATYLAEHFRIDAAEVPGLLRNEHIKARCERGEGEDEGCYRLSFRHGASRLSLVVDTSGRILRRTSIRWPKP